MANTSNQISTSNELSGWDEIRRVADEIRLEIHLGTMEARERWNSLQPELETLERKVAESGTRAGQAIASEIESLRDALRDLLDHVRRPH